MNAKYQYSLGLLFAVVTGFAIGLPLSFRTYHWVKYMSLLDLFVIWIASAGLFSVLVLFLFFLRSQRAIRR